jgi:hypothetical protein
MDKTSYDENNVATPTGVQYYEQMESMRNELSRTEVERDDAVSLLNEIAEADIDDLEDVMNKIKEFVESTPYAAPY